MFTKKGRSGFSHKKGGVGKIGGSFKKGAITYFHIYVIFLNVWWVRACVRACMRVRACVHACVCVCVCVCTLLIYTISILFVFHRKNLLLLNLINRFMIFPSNF